MALVATPTITFQSADKNTFRMFGTINLSGTGGYVAGGIPLSFAGFDRIKSRHTPIHVSFFSVYPAAFSLTLTQVAASVGGSAVYIGTITGGVANAFAGYTFVVTGFTNSANNGTFVASASTAGSLTLANASAVAETHAGTAANVANTTNYDYVFAPGSTMSNGAMQIFVDSGIAQSPNVELSGSSSATLRLGPVLSQYAILAAAGVTNTGSSVIGGNVGSFPTTSITPGAWVLTPPAVVDNTDAAAAQAAALSAYNYYSGLTFTSLGGALNLSTAFSGSNVVTPGNYSFGAATCSLGLVFNGPGLYVLMGSSTINLASGQAMTLTNGATADMIIWLVGSSLTTVATSTFVGTILANTSITLGGGTLNGRAYAGVVTTSGAVTISAATAITPSAGLASALPAGVTADVIGYEAVFVKNASTLSMS